MKSAIIKCVVCLEKVQDKVKSCFSYYLLMAEKVVDNLANRILELNYRAINEGNRFVVVTPEETVDLVEKQKNKNTQVQTASYIRLLKEWLKQKNDHRDPKDIEPVELDSYLAQFFISVRKASDGRNTDELSLQYEPGTLLAMQASVQRYLRDNNYQSNIKTDSKFRHSREVLAAKMKELKQLGKGNRPQASESFTSEELTVLKSQNLLGTSKLQFELVLKKYWNSCYYSRTFVCNLMLSH